MKLLINYNLERSFYEHSCDSCITFVSLYYFFLDFMIINISLLVYHKYARIPQLLQVVDELQVGYTIFF